jgi:hypothetical protein
MFAIDNLESYFGIIALDPVSNIIIIYIIARKIIQTWKIVIATVIDPLPYLLVCIIEKLALDWIALYVLWMIIHGPISPV